MVIWIEAQLGAILVRKKRSPMRTLRNRAAAGRTDAREVSAEQIKALTRARDHGTDTERRRAEEGVIEACLPRAAAVARHYRQRGVDADDIEQVARMGLIKAVRRWEPVKGELVGYLMPTMYGEVKRYFRDSGTAIRFPRSLYEAHPKVAAAERELSQRLSREPTIPDVAAASGLSESDVRRVRAARLASRPQSADTFADWIGDLTSPSAEEDLSASLLRADLRPAIAELTPRERRILALRFVWGQSQAEIASALGVSQMHVSRLLSATLAKLRADLSAQGFRAAA
jgi:RNA polymerase sigma-B factor